MICKQKLIFLFVLAISFLPLIAMPAEMKKQTVKLHIDHDKDKVVLKTDDGERDWPLSKEPEVSISANEYLQLVISDPNPVLFSYSLGEITKEPTASYLAVKNLAEAVKKAVGILSPEVADTKARLTTRKQKIHIGDLKTEEFLSSLEDVLNTTQDASSSIDTTLPGNKGGLKKAQNDVRGLDIENKIKTVIAGLNELQLIKAKLAAGKDVKVSVEVCLVNCPPNPKSGDFDSLRQIRDFLSATDKDLNGNVVYRFPGGPEVYETIFVLVSSSEQQLRSTAQLSKAFVDAFLKVGIPIDLSEPVAFDNANKQIVPVIIGANTQFTDLLSKAALAHQGKIKGTYKIAVVPDDKFSLSISAGAFYSFVRNPEYSVSEDMDGGLVVAQKENNYTKLGAAVGLDITLARWADYGFIPYFQIGVSPDSSNLAFLAGIGFRAYKQVTVSAGLTYQRVNELSGGLSVGDSLDSPDDFVTKKSFDSGLYIMLGYKF